MISGSIFLRLARHRAFWLVRFTCKALGRGAVLLCFKLRGWARQELQRGRHAFGLMRITIFAVVLVCATVYGLYLTNDFFLSLFKKLSLPLDSFDDHYVTLLAALTSAGGIFIGLYYAAVSAIGGVSYARMPNSVRRLLARERLGNAYMRIVSIYTVLGLILIACHVMGLGPVLVAVPIAAIGGGIVVFGFIRLGTRAFFLSDPTSLSHGLLEELARNYKQVQVNGYRWSEQSFQGRAHLNALENLESLVTVSDLAVSEPHLKGRPLASLCNSVLALLFDYEAIKPRIPTESNWYRKRHSYSSWYRADDNSTWLAHKTSTVLQPTTVSDSRWFEDTLLPLVYRCLVANLEARRYGIVVDVLQHLERYILQLVRNHHIAVSLDISATVFGELSDLLFAEADSRSAEQTLELMSVCGRLASLPIGILLSFVQVNQRSTRDQVADRVRKIRWKSPSSIYRAGFKEQSLSTLEWMRPRLEFEQRVEGKDASPLWYKVELLVHTEAKCFAEAMQCLHERVPKLYREWRLLARRADDTQLEASLLSMEAEYMNKLNNYAKDFNRQWHDLSSDRKLKDSPWPELDAVALEQQRSHHGTAMLMSMSEPETLQSLIAARTEVLPDFAGQFLHTIGEALIDAVCNNESDHFSQLFVRFLKGTMGELASHLEQEANADLKLENKLKVAVAPLLDLMTVSGFAYLFSDYYRAPRLAEVVTETWDAWLKGDATERKLQLLASAVSLSEGELVQLPHRSTNRTRWMRQVMQRLADIETKEVHYKDRLVPDSIVMHESPLVRLFAGEEFSPPYDGIDIFLARYIRRRPHGRELDFGWRRTVNLEQSIEAETKRYSRAMDT